MSGLAGQEQRYSLLFGNLESAFQNQRPLSLMAGLRNESGHICDFIMQTSPERDAILAGDLLSIDSHSVQLLHEHVPKLPGMIGPTPVTTVLSQAWSQQSGQKANIIYKQGVYLLGQLQSPRPCSGAFRLAELSDLDWLVKCGVDFHRQSIPHDPFSETVFAENLKLQIQKTHVGIWHVDGESHACGMILRPYRDLVCLGFIYTLPAQERQGFGSAVTHALCEHAFAMGYKRIGLYTNIEYAVSNSIYRKLGFELIDQAMVVRFVHCALD